MEALARVDEELEAGGEVEEEVEEEVLEGGREEEKGEEVEGGGAADPLLGGRWSLGSLEGLVMAVEAMGLEETLVVVSDGGLVQKIEPLPGGQGVLAQALMTAGWVVGVCKDGEKDAGMKIGRTRWVASGAIGVSATGGGKASSLVAEVGGMAAVMRVLMAVVERLGGDVAMPSVTHYCDNQALTKVVRRRLHVDSRQLRRSAARGWWAEVTRSMACWRGRGGRLRTVWRRGHPERHIRDPALWLDADRGNVAADGEATACEKDAGRLWLVRLQRDAVRVPGGSWKTEEVGEGLKAEHHAQERYRYLEERRWVARARWGAAGCSG